MCRTVLALIVLSAMVAPAIAQPSLTPISIPDAETPPVVRPAETPTPKSEGVATGLAFGTTFGGLGLVLVGAAVRSEALETLGGAAFFVGPSAGHIYAGENAHAVGMSLLRGAGAVTFLYGLIQETIVADGSPGGEGTYDRGNAKPAMIIGAATFVGATLYDLFDAHRAVRRANAEAGIVVTPMIGTQSAGVSVAGSF